MEQKNLISNSFVATGPYVVAAILMVAAVTTKAQTYFFALPYLPDTEHWETFVRHSAADVPSVIELLLINNNGQSAGRYRQSVPAGEARQFSNRHIKAQGVSQGPWWGWATWTGNAARPRIFLRSRDGFVVPLSGIAQRYPDSLIRALHRAVPATSIYQYGVRAWTLNPGRNNNQVGTLRVVNLSSTDTNRIFILLWDDRGEIGGVTLTLGPSEARTQTAAEIEGSAEVTQQGEWRVVILSTGLVTAQAGIWSRPTALYAPTTTEQPLVAPLTNQSQAAPIRQREAEYTAQSTAETDEAILERYAEALGTTLAGTQSLAIARQQGLHGGHITPPADLVEALRTYFD